MRFCAYLLWTGCKPQDSSHFGQQLLMRPFHIIDLRAGHNRKVPRKRLASPVPQRASYLSQDTIEAHNLVIKRKVLRGMVSSAEGVESLPSRRERWHHQQLTCRLNMLDSS